MDALADSERRCCMWLGRVIYAVDVARKTRTLDRSGPAHGRGFPGGLKLIEVSALRMD